MERWCKCTSISTARLTMVSGGKEGNIRQLDRGAPRLRRTFLRVFTNVPRKRHALVVLVHSAPGAGLCCEPSSINVTTTEGVIVSGDASLEC